MDSPVMQDSAGNIMEIVEQTHYKNGSVLLSYNSKINKGKVLIRPDGTHDEYLYDLNGALISYKSKGKE